MHSRCPVDEDKSVYAACRSPGVASDSERLGGAALPISNSEAETEEKKQVLVAVQDEPQNLDVREIYALDYNCRPKVLLLTLNRGQYESEVD